MGRFEGGLSGNGEVVVAGVGDRGVGGAGYPDLIVASKMRRTYRPAPGTIVSRGKCPLDYSTLE